MTQYYNQNQVASTHNQAHNQVSYGTETKLNRRHNTYYLDGI